MSAFRPGERVVTPYGLGTVRRVVSPFGPAWIEVQRDGQTLCDHYRHADLRPVTYRGQFTPPRVGPIAPWDNLREPST